jgi:hypothetical protein
MIPNEYNGEKNDAKHFKKQNTHKHGHSIFWKAPTSFYTLQAYLQIHLKIPWTFFHK